MKTVVLLSGGLDSATVLYSAKSSDCECYTLSFNYNQSTKTPLNGVHGQLSTLKPLNHPANSVMLIFIKNLKVYLKFLYYVFFYQGRSLSLVLFWQQRLWARECVSFLPVH